jgi:hypothetical protein
MSRTAALSLLFAFGLLVFSCVAYGQAPTGTISGNVKDESGAVVPSATVSITNKATDLNRTITTNAEGLFSAPALVPGEYEVRVEMQGFRTVIRAATVVAGSGTTVDMTLSLGTTQEVVTVEAATAQITYDSHTVAGVIPRESIQDLPLNGRSSLQLASLEPGVTVNAGATSQFNAMFNVSILGSNGGATAGSGVGPIITMDGGVINDEVEGGTSMNFSQEVVQEFQIASANFDASTGIAVGGAVNIVTRSGSNDFHGSAYFFFRDHNMAAYPGPEAQRLQPQPVLCPAKSGRLARRTGSQGQVLFLLQLRALEPNFGHHRTKRSAFAPAIEFDLAQPASLQLAYREVRLPSLGEAHAVRALLARWQCRFWTVRRHRRAFRVDSQQQLERPKHHGAHQRVDTQPGQRSSRPVSLLGQQRTQRDSGRVPAPLHRRRIAGHLNHGRVWHLHVWRGQ